MKNSKLTRLFSTAAVVGTLAAPGLAQEEEGIFIPGASAQITLDYVTQYFFRGYEQLDSDQGIVLQPGASFTIDISENATATIGTWGSINTDAPTAPANPSSWYEQDIYASYDRSAGDVSYGVGLTAYTYPALAANTVLEANAYLSYDDSDLLGDLAFNPYVMVAVELNNTNTNSATGDEGTYLEVGGTFSLPTEGTAIEAWDWSIPFAIGMSLDDYYNDGSTAAAADEFFGFASVGVVGTIPMSELIGSDEYVGAWDLSVGVTVLFLNSDVPLTDNFDDNSDNIQFVGTVGISRSW